MKFTESNHVIEVNFMPSVKFLFRWFYHTEISSNYVW
jgi:hypothetical protein